MPEFEREWTHYHGERPPCIDGYYGELSFQAGVNDQAIDGWKSCREAVFERWRRFRSRSPRDLGKMPNYMKQDLGFLDGRDPRHDDELRR